MDLLLQEFLPDRIRRTKERLKVSQESSPAKIEWLAHCMGVSPSRLYQQLDPNIEARLGRLAFTQPRALESVKDINLQGIQVFGKCAEFCQLLAELGGPGEPEISWERFKQFKQATRQLHKVLAVVESSVRQQAARHASWPWRLLQRLARAKRTAGGGG